MECLGKGECFHKMQVLGTLIESGNQINDGRIAPALPCHTNSHTSRPTLSGGINWYIGIRSVEGHAQQQSSIQSV